MGSEGLPILKYTHIGPIYIYIYIWPIYGHDPAHSVSEGLEEETSQQFDLITEKYHIDYRPVYPLVECLFYFEPCFIPKHLQSYLRNASV